MPKSIINKPLLLLAILFASFYFLFGCVAAPVKDAEDLTPQEIPSGQKAKSATSIQTQSPKVASTPHIRYHPKPDSHIKLAVLPYYIKLSHWGGESTANISPTTMNKISIDSLNKVLRDHREMVPTYSYYELAKEFKANKITGRIINEKDVNNLWVKQSGIPTLMNPNENCACKIGNKLKVDTVLLYSINRKPGEPNYTMALYFIDVETKKTFSQITSFDYRTYQNEIKNLFEQSFDTYRMKESKFPSGSEPRTQVAAISKIPNKFDGRWELDSSNMFYMFFNIKDGKIVGKMGNATWPKDIHLPIKGKVSQEGKFKFEYAGHLDVNNGYELEVTNASAEKGFIEGYAYDDFNKRYTWKVFRK